MLLCISGAFTKPVNAQSIITSAGNTGFTTSSSLSWTLGEIVVNTYSSPDVVLTHGFQQATVTVTSITGLTSKDFTISVYPNPAKEFIIMEIEEFKNFSYFLYDEKGKLLQNGVIVDKRTEIKVNNFIPGNYFLKITRRNKDLKTFKILKVN